MNDLNLVQPTPTQLKEWENVRALLLTATPAFAHIFYELMTVGEHLCVFTDSVPVAATDGKHMAINPATFFRFDAGERLFIVCHEIMHAALNHCYLFEMFSRTGRVPYPDGTQLRWVAPIGNIAVDLIVNAILIDGHVGRFNPDWLHDRTIATPSDDFLSVYRKLFATRKLFTAAPQRTHAPGQGQPGPTGASNSPAQHEGKEGFDQHLAPGTIEGKHPVQAQAEKNEGQWRRVVDAAVEQARMQGRLPAGLERLFARTLEPQVDWQDRLAADIHRTIGNGSWTYENPDEEWADRDIFVPGRASYGAGDVVVGSDTSGSVSAEEISMAYAEIAGIMEQLRPKRLFVLWCDAKVHQVDVLEDAGDLANIPVPKGGGGTSFVPVFEWIAEQDDLQLDGLIFLTDGFGTFCPTPPNYPVIWGCVSPPGQATFPYGEVVYIPRQAKGRP